MAKNSKNRAREATEATRRRLWVRAGGRCEMRGCNKYLLDDHVTRVKVVPLGEAAHNVPASPQGPRGEHSLADEELRLEQNLLLLCLSCHKIVDNTLTSGAFTMELLKQYKLEHESRIHLLTGIDSDRRSTVLRMVGRIRGNAISLSPEELRVAMFESTTRYPDYRSREHELDIDLTAFEESETNYWEQCTRVIHARLERFLDPGLRREHVSHISLFAFARIPLLAFLGYELGDKIPIDIFEKQRSHGELWGWDDRAASYDFETVFHTPAGQTTAVVLISVSGKIDRSLIPVSLESKSPSIVEILPVGAGPGRGIFQNQQTLFAFRDCYQRLLRTLEKDADEIAILPAAPLSAGVTLGREVLREVTPPVTIYDAENGSYQPTVTINE